MCVCVLPSAAGRQLSSGGKVRLVAVVWWGPVGGCTLAAVVTRQLAPAPGHQHQHPHQHPGHPGQGTGGSQCVLGVRKATNLDLQDPSKISQETLMSHEKPMNEDMHLPKSEFMSDGVHISCDSRHICCSKEPHCPANRHLCQQPALDNTYISPAAGQQAAADRRQPALWA